MSDLPPGDWDEQTAGDWGTKVVEDAATTFASKSTVKFVAGASVGGIVSKRYAMPAGVQAVPMQFVVRTANTATALIASAIFYDGAGASLGVKNFNLSSCIAANRWEIQRDTIDISKTGAASFEVVISPGNSTNNCWLAQMSFPHPARRFRLRRTTTTTVADATVTRVPLNGSTYNIGSAANIASTYGFDPAADSASDLGDKHNANYATYWQFNAGIQLDSVPAGTRCYIALYKNSVEWIRGQDFVQGPSGADVMLQIATQDVVLESDVIDVRVYQDSGSTLTINSGAGFCYFAGHEF